MNDSASVITPDTENKHSERHAHLDSLLAARERLTTRIFLLLLEILIIFGVPAFGVLGLMVWLDLSRGRTLIGLGLAMIFSWAMMIIRWRQVMAEWHRLQGEIAVLRTELGIEVPKPKQDDEEDE